MNPGNFDKDRRFFYQYLSEGKFHEAWVIWDRSLEQSPREIEVSQAIGNAKEGPEPISQADILAKKFLLGRLYELGGNPVYATRYIEEFLTEASVSNSDKRPGKLLLARLAFSQRRWAETISLIDESFSDESYSRRSEAAFWKSAAALECGEFQIAFEAVRFGQQNEKNQSESVWFAQLFEIGVRAAVASGDQGDSIRRSSEYEVFAFNNRPDLKIDSLILSAAVNAVFLRMREAVGKAQQAIKETDRRLEEGEEWILWAIQIAGKGFLQVPFRKRMDQPLLFHETKLNWRRGYAFAILCAGDFLRSLSQEKKKDLGLYQEFLSRAGAGFGTIPPQVNSFLNMDGYENKFTRLCRLLWAGLDVEQGGSEMLTAAALSYKRVIRESDDFPCLSWLAMKRFEKLLAQQGQADAARETSEKADRLLNRIGFELLDVEEDNALSAGKIGIPDLGQLRKPDISDEMIGSLFLELCRNQNWPAIVVLVKEGEGIQLIGVSGDEKDTKEAIGIALEGIVPEGYLEFSVHTKTGLKRIMGSGPASLAIEIIGLEREKRRLSNKVDELIPYSRVPEIERNSVKGNDFGIIGQSKPVNRVLELLERLKRNQSEKAVLITGETGTGKEVFAKAIHSLSPRAGKPLNILNCGAIPRELIQSELFGHRKGSFTGASEDRPGAIRSSHGGTLFLDEIGELPLDLQVNLLRFLQEGEVRPVGEEKVHRVDVRIISATNRNLEAEVEKGNFREDLFQRLRVVEVNLPPLRERKEDIPLLASFFLEKDGSEVRCSEAALNYLCSLPWKGNIRELENRLNSVLALLGPNEKYIQPYHFTDPGNMETTPMKGDTDQQGVEEFPWYLVDLRQFRGMSLQEAEKRFGAYLVVEERRRLENWEDFFQLYPGTGKTPAYDRLKLSDERVKFHSSPRKAKTQEVESRASGKKIRK